MSPVLRSPFPYYGAKISLSRRLLGLLSPHRVYIEPFFGSGALFFAKPPSRIEIINDLDEMVVTFLRVLRDHPEDLARRCALTPHARSEFNQANLNHQGDEIELARRFWVRANQSFARVVNARTGWSITTARSQSIPGSVRSRLARFAACAERLMEASIECDDAVSLIARLAPPDTLLYVDPPYLATTRSNRTSTGTGDYRHDPCSEQDHRALAEVLTQTPATVLLSGYPSALYDELYPHWARRTFSVTAHSSNATTRHRALRTEVVWSNRPLPTAEQLQLNGVA